MGQITSWPDDSVRSEGRVESAASGSTQPLEIGNVAPLFTLPDADMEMFDLSDALSKHLLVLHFYPRDAMPSSIRQAIAFSDHESEFTRCGAQVVGVSLDDCLTHADFRDAHGLAIRLLSDTDGDVCRMYHVWQEKFAEGVIRPAVHRSTFVIGRDGVVLHADYLVDVRDHTTKLLELLNSLSGRKNGNRKEHRRHA